MHRWFLIVPLALVALSAAAGERDDLLAKRRAQLRQKWEQQFRAADTDHSRTLTLDEARKAGLPPSLIDHFADIDSNHDGQLTPEELMAVYEKQLDAQAARRPPRH